MDWWTALGSTEKVFWGIAIVSTFLLVFQFILSFIGADIDADADADFSGDADLSVFSFRGILAFLTFFSWGVVGVLNNGGSLTTGLITGGIAGTAAMFIVAYMMLMAHRLQESGTLHLESALGEVGEVYLRIPEEKSGKGKIQISLQGSVRELDAVTEGGLLPTGTVVEIIEILNDNTLVVQASADVKQLN